MNSNLSPRREIPQLRWSTAALLGGGLAGTMFGMLLGLYVARENSAPRPERAAALSASASADRSTPAQISVVRHEADFETQWQRSLVQPPSLVRDEDMGRALETLAARDPARAVALALAETNRVLRQTLIAAALRGWAGVAFKDATRWALQRPLNERALAVATVISSRAGTPEEATELAAHVVRDDPALAHDHGCALVFALARVGEFDAAARFAVAGPAAYREAWLTNAFTVWAEHQPENALAAATALADPALRTEAFHAAVAGWTSTNPAALAEFATHLAPGADRAYALQSALREWVNHDLVAASNWIDRCNPGAELDSGAAAVATAAPLIARHPDVALNWAESVTDADLRSQTIAAVLREWAKTAPIEARRYASASPNLRSGDRSSVLADLGVAPDS